MIRIIVAKWGEKYNDTYINNLKHMIDTYSGINYDKFEVFTKNNYGNIKFSEARQSNYDRLY